MPAARVRRIPQIIGQKILASREKRREALARGKKPLDAISADEIKRTLERNASLQSPEKGLLYGMGENRGNLSLARTRQTFSSISQQSARDLENRERRAFQKIISYGTRVGYMDPEFEKQLEKTLKQEKEDMLDVFRRKKLTITEDHEKVINNYIHALGNSIRGQIRARKSVQLF
jgi:hypothetical protein